MKPVHAKRLLRLADFLDSLPRKRFDYTTWTGIDWKPELDLKSHACGTTACALGWATVMPEFRRLGACLNGDGGPTLKGNRHVYAHEVSAHLFGLDEDDHGVLFSPDEEHPVLGWRSPGDDATAKQVARHIRKFVASRVST